MDLSFPHSTSVNDGIPSDQFLGEPFKLTYPTIRTLMDIIRDHGQGCLLYKLDLRRAYRQLPVDPHDYHLLGFWWRDSYYVDTRLPFGLRSAPQACQRSTNAIVYMHTKNGHHAVNYLDDFCGVSPSSRALTAFNSLRDLLVELGLEEATEKTVSPTTHLTFIGLDIDTVAMTVAVPPEKLAEIRSILITWQGRQRATRRQLQSLIGKLAFAAACIPPGRIFMSRLLTALRSKPSSYLSPTPFSIEDGLVTPTLKFKRPALAVHFDDKIKQLYEEIETGPQKKNPSDKKGW
ncbi:hypothetical protein QZH41_014981 [Actinostola sp. cb2023]|nr:hypothetical protein QZH41_014981 [Actinostola sp. cb2023]